MIVGNIRLKPRARPMGNGWKVSVNGVHALGTTLDEAYTRLQAFRQAVAKQGREQVRGKQ